MKKAVASFILILSTMAMAQAQNSLNSNPDAIIGTYHIEHKGHVSRVRIYKCTDGTYGAQCIYLKDSTDVKNPNKALRNTPCNRNTILRGLRYNADKKRWEKGNIYDPTRGIYARCTCEFTADHKLKLRGSVLGIGETVYWQPLF